MHLDLEHAASDAGGHSPICILGGGIAGLVLATRLAEYGINVTVLEAGGLDLEERSQKLYEAEMPEQRHTGTTEGRFRTYGGSSTRWGGQLLCYPEDIFHPVPGAPSRPWPIGPQDLEAYYGDILALFQVPTLPFDHTLLSSLGHEDISFGPDINLRYSKWSPFQRRNLARTIGRDALTHAGIRIVTHANVAELEGQDGVIHAARVLDYKGREFRFTAQRFVVCCGTIESARLLLSSPAVPNPFDQIGRGFSDHLSIPVGVLRPLARSMVSERLGPFFVDGVLYTLKLEASSPLQRECGMLAVMAHFTIEEPEGGGIGAMRNLLTSIQRRRFREAFGKNLLPMLAGLGDVVRLLWALKVRKRRGMSHRAVMRVAIDLEQSPDSPNHIALSQQRDALGLRKAVVHWSVSEEERETVRRYAPLVRSRLEALGITDIDWDPALGAGRPITLADTFHPLGGLRMGHNPADSVVDTDLKVHATSNLYVASCAVFPSGGSSNPTFTMIALAMRLANHLRG